MKPDAGVNSDAANDQMLNSQRSIKLPDSAPLEVVKEEQDEANERNDTSALNSPDNKR